MVKFIFLSLAIAVMSIGVVGCEKQGPAEEFGENVDEAVNDAGRAIEDATD